MASILKSTAVLLFLAASASAASAPEYQGCYSTSTPLTKNGTWTWQTSGYCQNQCVPKNTAVMALSEGNQCWCGNELPPQKYLVSDDNCNTPCDGYDTEDCGGQGYWSFWSTGLTSGALRHYSGVVNPPSSASPSTSTTTTSTPTPTPSVVTTVLPGTTIIRTNQPSSTSSAAASSGKSGSVNVAGIAAGVVIAVVVITAAVGGFFIWLRYRKRREAEEEYERAQAAEMARNAERKPPPTSWSGNSDSRLEPTLDRRNSFGSIADNEDYSRKILRVANPDRNSAFPPPERSAWPPHRG